jgi:hypothetical protein
VQKFRVIHLGEIPRPNATEGMENASLCKGAQPKQYAKVSEMNIPLRATNNYTTERLLELALAMLDNARREQSNGRFPTDNWLTNNFTLEIIRAKVEGNKANAAINV